MTSLLLSIVLLLQAPVPVGVKALTGRVTVEGGAPTPSSFTLPLTAANAVAPTPGLTRGAAGTGTLIRTQIDGGFRLQLPVGEYRVGEPAPLPAGYSVQSILYGGVDVLRNPLRVSAGDSGELVINLAVKGPAPTVSVSGRVTGITPGQVLRISLREPSGGQISAALETSVAADGSFKFSNVLPGNYIAYFRLRAVTQVRVGNTDVTGVVVAVPQDILTSGHVILEGPQGTIPAILVESNGKTATSNRAGTFVLSLEKGDNAIAVRNIPDTHSIKSITYGDVDLQKEPLKLDGPALWDIVVRLVPRN